MSTKITLFKLDTVTIAHRKPGLVTDIWESGLMKFRPFTDPHDYLAEPFPFRDI